MPPKYPVIAGTNNHLPIQRASGRSLARGLEYSGRPMVCEVKGCESEYIEVHHIIPFGVAAIMYRYDDRSAVDHIANLAFLCRDHHSLVERHYWWARILGAPKELVGLHHEVVAIAKSFHDRQVPQDKIEKTRVYSDFAWKQLNTCAHHNPLWWQATYAQALKWAQHQEILWSVAPAQAIVSDPWFRDSRGRQLIESEAANAHPKQA